MQKCKKTHKTRKSLYRLVFFFTESQKNGIICDLCLNFWTCLAPQNNHLNLSFEKKVGKKIAKSGLKVAIYHSKILRLKDFLYLFSLLFYLRLSGAEWLFAIIIRQRNTLAMNCEDIFWHFSNTTNPICLFLGALWK